MCERCGKDCGSEDLSAAVDAYGAPGAHLAMDEGIARALILNVSNPDTMGPVVACIARLGEVAIAQHRRLRELEVQLELARGDVLASTEPTEVVDLGFLVVE